MAAKVGPSTVSYGIGVQNRYSAFLEDEDSFALSNIIKRPTNEHHVVSKPKSTVKSSGTKTGQRSDLSTTNQNKKQDVQQKSPSSQTNGQQVRSDVRRQQRDGKPPQQQQQHQVNGSSGQPARNHVNRNRNYNQDGAVHANGSQRFPRNHQNGGTHQQQSDNASHPQSKENQSNHNGRPPMRTNTLRSNPRPRIQNDDKRAGQQQHDGQQVNGHLASNDDEKARRQQKRLNNLRFKDPEKRERRNLVASDGPQDTQAKVNDQNDERSADQRGQRNRRDSDKNRARPRRNPNGESNGDATVRRDNRRERPNRQRGEFGGSHPDGGNKQEKPKPIPNFSDKSDFPSLAS